MRKNLLTLSIAAMVGGLSGAAAYAGPVLFDNSGTTNYSTGTGTSASTSAVIGVQPAATATSLEFNSDGVGHVLLVPYFTTNGGNMSLLNIVNTDLTNGKAVKLRYRNALNSDDVFDITVYLSPGDVWAANVSVDAAGYSHLVTDDASCTVPNAAAIKAADDGRFGTSRVLNRDPLQTREGYIEILNTADIRPFLNDAAGVQDVSKPNPLWAAIKHTGSKAPCTPGVVENPNLLTNVAGDPDSPRLRGYSWPTGGLFANWVIVNAADKASFSGEAAAIAAVGTGTKRAAGNLVWFPQSNAAVTAADAATLTADPLLINGRIDAAIYDFPDLSTPYTSTPAGTPKSAAAQAIALSNSMAVKSVSNEYLTSTGVNFATDWVFSMPTRRYQMAVDYATRTAVQNTPTAASHFVIRNNPTAGANLGGNVAFDPATYSLCVNGFTASSFNREEESKSNLVISPKGVMTFCGEANVVTFNTATSLLGAVAGSPIQQTINTGFGDGWLNVATPGYLGNGLPVIGFAAAKTRGANLGGTWTHRVTR